MDNRVLTINAGSSSVKFALFASAGKWPKPLASGQIEGIGAAPSFRAQIIGSGDRIEIKTGAADHEQAIGVILEWIEQAFPEGLISAIGHRIVHGGLAHAAPAIIDDAMLADLRKLEPLAPLHQPHNIAGVDAARAAYPHAPQVACFDTAFHRSHSFVHDAYALPHRYYEAGLRRFGFHGLSYEYIARRLREAEPILACGRIIVAHLGNGASLCAMRDGRSVATTMGFSTLDGLAMGTRCGQIDPGLLLYLLTHERMSIDELTHLLYEQSGLKGLSQISQDMRTLEASDSQEAHQAIAYFVNRIRMEIGALTTALAGLDGLVFTAGIGERSAVVRAGVIDRMQWLGLELDAKANMKNAPRISKQGATPILILPTDEEAMIADHTIVTAGLAAAED
jgi:acetate kinase